MPENTCRNCDPSKGCFAVTDYHKVTTVPYSLNTTVTVTRVNISDLYNCICMVIKLYLTMLVQCDCQSNANLSFHDTTFTVLH